MCNYSFAPSLLPHSGLPVSAHAAGLGKLYNQQHRHQDLLLRATATALRGVALALPGGSVGCPSHKKTPSPKPCPAQPPPPNPSRFKYSQKSFSKSVVVTLGGCFFPSTSTQNKLKGCTWCCSTLVKSKVRRTGSE